MKNRKETIRILDELKNYYPEAKGSLDFNNAFQLAVAVLLSAQCTDKRVNEVTPRLFAKAPNATEMAKLTQEEIEEYVRPCGFYRNKAKNILMMSKQIVEKHGGEVPETMKELTALAGIGRKSANVIMLQAFNNPEGVAIDTHAKRICNRLGISYEQDPNKIEKELLKKIEKRQIHYANHVFVIFGRDICKARNPQCESCPIKKDCEYVKEIEMKK